jgi:hypothetical protein
MKNKWDWSYVFFFFRNDWSTMKNIIFNSIRNDLLTRGGLSFWSIILLVAGWRTKEIERIYYVDEHMRKGIISVWFSAGIWNGPQEMNEEFLW